ncbi:hypothetical protein [Pseudomonas moraviensis]|jgi:hypothetical protein
MLFWSVILSLAAVALGLLAAEGTDNVAQWSNWMRTHHAALLVWRLPLYIATVYGWYRMRVSLIKRGFTFHQHQRLLYAEVAAITVLAMLELLTFRTA